ncbi:threonine-phosphate decarboxylase CobD [Ferrimonas kyonanensis]|uniref:threonine-phosphate decarboxylase CobD n=1 Tax=Ferrimonas kyonanensis TaxID=364763 RepID=UPI00040DA653|nr:threonine-phosphate decarboxylase CobD [Ferrimonas kyonanensis]
MSALHHGGRLRQAVAEFGIERSQWLDLSTGVSPWTYPLEPIPLEQWNRLPEEEDGLERVARSYYDCQSLLPVAGSQAAIQALPRVLKTLNALPSEPVVALPRVGYKEHQKAWLRAGWRPELYDKEPDSAMLAQVQALVVINPNNPTGYRVSSMRLMQWHRQLAEQGGTLVVDEAFADVDPKESISHWCPQPNLVVLRSIGKFFGLAGIRAGFVLAEQQVLTALTDLLGPWTVAGPSREACRQALADRAWQQSQRARLERAALRLAAMLSSLPGTLSGTPLFQTLLCDRAEQWHRQLCQQGILVRLTDEKDGLRVGLPASAEQWQRLQEALLTLS